MTKVIAIANQKGGVRETTTTVNLGVGLSRKGYKGLLIEADAPGNLTEALGWHQPDELPITIGNCMHSLIEYEQFDSVDGILHHAEGRFCTGQYRAVGAGSIARHCAVEGEHSETVH